jgi:hypothetical protein
LLERLIHVRRDSNRGVYLSCGAVVLLAFVLAEETGLRSMWPYYALLFACAFQAWRPTLLLWCLLMTTFLAALGTVIFAGTATAIDRVVFAVVLGGPIIALWHFRPAPHAESAI